MTSTPAVQKDHWITCFSVRCPWRSRCCRRWVHADIFRGYRRRDHDVARSSARRPVRALDGAVHRAGAARDAGKTRWHRRVGVAGAFFAVVILVSGTVTAIVAVRHEYMAIRQDRSRRLRSSLPRRFATWWSSDRSRARRSRWSPRPDTQEADAHGHARRTCPAGAGRFSNPVFGLIVLLVLLAAGPAYDWLSHRRVYGAYIWGIGVTLGSWAIFYALAQTSVWQSFAQGLIE